METIVIKAAQLILSLSILVIIHECGHFLFAKLFKVRVEKFYVFFDPWFSLFKYKPKGGETEYGVGWLPLGGYVKISGMIDESMDKNAMAQPPQPWEFRVKPTWQRLLIMVGGVLMNFVLAFFIYSMVLLRHGDDYLLTQDIHSTVFSDIAKEVGFRDGDRLVSADGKELALRDKTTLDMNTLVAILSAEEVNVIREGKQILINIPDDFMDRFVKAKEGFWAFDFPVVIRETMDGSEARKIGLQTNDRILSINGISTETYSVFREEMDNNKGKTIDLGFLREGKEIISKANIDTAGMLGISLYTKLLTIYNDKVHHRNFSFFGSFPAGITLGIETLKGYIAQFRLVFTKAGLSNLGGFGSIGNLFPAQWDWNTFWMMTAFLSIILAVMNLLPIPALDGGHVMFLIYEAITGRKPNDKFMEYAQVAGMIFLLLLLVYANGNDLLRFFGK
jgi:regulator of sigma E protease